MAARLHYINLGAVKTRTHCADSSSCTGVWEWVPQACYPGLEAQSTGRGPWSHAAGWSQLRAAHHLIPTRCWHG